MSLRSGDEIQEALRSFIGRWGNYAGTERSEAQTFLNELFGAYGAARHRQGHPLPRAHRQLGASGDHCWPGLHLNLVHRVQR